MSQTESTVRGPRRSLEKERSWRCHLREQAKSRLSVQAYCRSASISEASFYAWRRELAKRDAASPAARSSRLAKRSRQSHRVERQSRFLPVTISASPAGQVELVLPGPTTIRVPASETAALLLILEWLKGTLQSESEELRCSA